MIIIINIIIIVTPDHPTTTSAGVDLPAWRPGRRCGGGSPGAAARAL
jgi:hypothetical protein